VYDRDYSGKTINFEASGGLINSSLVMQDDETNSYWAIMSGESIAGKFKGTKLTELPVGEKMQWKEWVKKYPNTQVLSVQGKEQGFDSYRRYFKDSQGFRGQSAHDSRLKTKEPIFAFKHNGNAIAAAHRKLEGGAIFVLADGSVFLYRRKGADLFESTSAFLSPTGFEKKDGTWVEKETGCSFDAASAAFAGDGECAARIGGFDTFWYNWSLNNPDTKLLK